LAIAVLWIRSYAYRDEVGVPYGTFGYAMIQSHPGRLVHCVFFDAPLNGDLAKDKYYPYLMSFEPLKKRSDLNLQTIAPRIGIVASSLGVEMVIPYWVLVTLVGALAYLPWWSWLFSLRNLLILLAIVAVLLASVKRWG
jgi:hypothetical protein